MSNEILAYGLPYSSVTQSASYQAQNVSSSAPYHGLQAIAVAAATYGAPEYQSQRHTQQRPSNGGASFNWYGNSMGSGAVGRGTDSMGSDDTREEQPKASARSSSQALYDGSSLGSYAYDSTSNCASNQGSVQERTVGTSSQGAHGSRPNNESANVRIPYQPYSWDLEQSGVGSAGSILSQQGMAHSERRTPAEQASGARPCMPPSQSAMNSATTAKSYSCYPSNAAVPRNNVSSTGNWSDSVESTVRHTAQNSLSPKYGFEGNEAPALQSFCDQRSHGTPIPPPVTQVRKRQAATRTAQRQKTRTPPSHVQQSVGSLPHQNGPQYKKPPRANTSSTPANPANTVQSTQQPNLGHRYNVSQSSQIYSTNPFISEHQSASSTYHSQTQEGNTSAVFRDPLINLRPPSPTVPTTVDPSHVYNRYHEYQKQIEAIDAEHARLAALKAEREAAEAAAALASAKTVSQTMNATRSQLENGRAHEVGSQLKTLNLPAPNPNKSSNLASGDQDANQNVPDTQAAAPDPQRQPPAADLQKMVAMEEEMRLMVEKMREYQNQDPQLFAHVWKSVKKTHAPRPRQAQIRTGEDLIRTSIESQNKQQPSPVSTSSQPIPPLMPRSEPAEVTNTPARPPRKRKSRSKAALAEQAAENSQGLTVSGGERLAADVAPTAASHSHSSTTSPRQTQKWPPHTDRESQCHTNTSVQSSAISPIQHREISTPRHVAFDGISNQSSTASSVSPKQNQVNSTNHTPVDPALLRHSTQTVQSSVAAMNRNASNTPPTNPGVIPRFTAEGQSKTGVLWPEEHRDAIANTAARVLNAIPENSGKKIAAIQILNMLGCNPSYIELCELIEGIGFKMDRARFAKAILAAIPAVNAKPAQAAESKASQMSNSLATFKDNQPFNRGFSNVAEESPSIGQSGSAPGQAPSLSVESTTPVLAMRHCETEQDNTTPNSRGPGSRGPYPKTKERISEVQNSPSSSKPRRGPRRPRKHGLPPIKGVSNGPPNGNSLIDPALANAQNSHDQSIIQPPGQAPLNATFSIRSDSVEERLVIALKGGLHGERDLVTTGSNQITTQPTGTSAEPSELQSQNNHSGRQSIKGWYSHALFDPPARAVNGDVNSGPIVAPPATLPPTPLTKEMAARKRTFAEIIDLTSEDIPVSIEDHPLIASKVRRVGDTNFQSADGYDGAQELKMLNESAKHQRSHLTVTTRPILKPPQSHRPTSSTLAVASPIPNPYKDFEEIVKPIDRSVALRKSRYDPRTIARDILIATARHPFQRGLNAHLEPLKARLTMVDGSSDLSTFRWDIVDPGGPPVGSSNMSTPSEVQNKSYIGPDDSSSSRAVLGGVKLPVGRGPLRPTRGDGSIRGRGGSSLQQTQTRIPAQPSGLRFSSTVESNFAVVIESTAPETSHDSGHPRKNRPDGIDSASPARLRSRPPKNLSATSQLVTPSPKRIGRLPKSLSSGIGMRGNSAGRKAGGPRIHPQSESKPLGRPRKSDPKLVTPKFIPFLCEWRGCKAELHNLETLRRHIYSVHNKAKAYGAIACQWSKCGLTRQVHDESTPKSTPEPKFVHEDHEFAGMEEFMDHMEKAHLIPFAWHMGDGPRGSTLGTFPPTNP